MEEIVIESMFGVVGITGCGIYACDGNINALIFGGGIFAIAIAAFAFTLFTGSCYGRDIMNALHEHRQNRMNAELHERRNESMRLHSNDNTFYTL